MTPPIRPSGGGTSLTRDERASAVSASSPGSPTHAASSYFVASPLLELRSDPRNPIRTSRPIRTIGDVRDAIVLDFFRDRLRTPEGLGAEVVQLLGSAGMNRPETPLGAWNPDNKPDFNIVGDAEVILRRLAPFQGWSDEVLERNLTLARRGMVYYNVAIETPSGPIPFKMGILDRNLWREGTLYFDLRTTLVPVEGSYVYFNDTLREPATPRNADTRMVYRMDPLGGANGSPITGARADGSAPITRSEFEAHILRAQTDVLGRSLDLLHRPDSFTANDFINHRFWHQFHYYERIRGVFERSKGPQQRRRFEREGVDIDALVAPAMRQYLTENSGLLEVRDGDKPIDPSDISARNFRGLNFTWLRSPDERHVAYELRMEERPGISAAMWDQTGLNRASNRTSRPGYHAVGNLTYLGRKLARKLGLANEPTALMYTPEASHFNSTDERLGRVENPLSQMIILAGYNPGDESDPKVFRKTADYARDEIARGFAPNLLIPGNNPSKFTMPIRGVPAITYRFVDALYSPAVRDIVVVGTPDVGVALEAFQAHPRFAAEIAARGKSFTFVNVGLGGGSFTGNIQLGLDNLARPGEPAVLSMGDTPRVDIHNMAYHPYRHNLDYSLGTNSRDLVMDFMGMNAHYQMNLDGVEFPFKEGNVQLLRNFPEELWNQMFVNRKSVGGAGSKAGIFFRYLFSRPTHSNPLDTVLDIFNLGATVGETGFKNWLHRRLGGQFPKFGGDVELGERIVQNRVNWRADFRPFHLDMGGLVDIDGIRDWVIGEVVGEKHPHPHQAEMDAFARETLPAFRDRLPLLDGAGTRINNLYLRIFDHLLQEEAERPTNEKLGITDESLRRLGFDPNCLPFTEEGKLNAEWLSRVIPPEEIETYRRAFAAYDNRVDHARDLASDFEARNQATRPYDADLRVSEKVQRFALEQLNAEPERYRGLILEWDFDRVEARMVERAQRRFSEFAPEVADLRTYFRQSTAENLDTPLRRVLTGFKAVDVLRRYQSFLSPAEFQEIYKTLVESIGEAREVVSGNRWLGIARRRGLSDGRFFLRGFLDQAQTTADEAYVRRVGESSPEYRSRGIASLFGHSADRDRVYRDSSGAVTRADSAVWRAADVAFLSRRLEILPSRIPHLIAAAGGISSRGDLATLPEDRLTYERTLAWTQTVEGQQFLRNNSRLLHDRVENRIRESGPGLAFGLASLLGGEYLADRFGLDARHHPHERFAFVVGASHLVNQGVSGITEVGLNRALGSPFDFATTRVVNAGGETALQYGLEARGNMARAMAASLTRSFGLEGGFARMAYNGTRGMALLPFRSAWGMGPGLMSSAIVDATLGNLIFPDGGAGRTALHLGSFFLPELYHIGVGNRGAAIFESRAMGFATRAFAVGFIADMTYMGLNRLSNGSEGAATNNLIFGQANELYDQNERGISLITDGVLEMMAPSLMAWWDSHEFDWGRMTFSPNRYERQVRGEIRDVSARITEHAAESFRTALLFGAEGENFDANFYRNVGYGFLRNPPALRNIRNPSGRLLPIRDVYEQIGNPEVYRTRIEGRSQEDQIRYIQDQFRGHRLSRGDVETILQQIGLYRLRTTAASIHAFEMPQNATMRGLLDATGSLRAGREGALLDYSFGGSMTESGVLDLRRVGLALRILQLRERSHSAAAGDLGRFESVAREIGMLDASGTFVESEAYRQALRQYESSRARLLPPRVEMSGLPFTRDPSGSGSLTARTPMTIRVATRG